MVKIHTSSFILIDPINMDNFEETLLANKFCPISMDNLYSGVDTMYGMGTQSKKEREIEVHVFLPSLTGPSTVPAFDFHQHEGTGNLTCLCSCSALSHPHPYTHGMFSLVLPCRKKVAFSIPGDVIRLLLCSKITEDSELVECFQDV